MDIEEAIKFTLMKNPLEVGMAYSIWDVPNILRFCKKEYPQATITAHKAKVLLELAIVNGAPFVYNITSKQVQAFKCLIASLDETQYRYCFCKYLGKYVDDKEPEERNGMKTIRLTGGVRFHYAFFYCNIEKVDAFDYAIGIKNRVTAKEWGNTVSDFARKFNEYQYLILPYAPQSQKAVYNLTIRRQDTKFIMVPSAIYMDVVPVPLKSMLEDNLYRGIGKDSGSEMERKFSQGSTAPYYFNVSSKRAIENRLKLLVNECGRNRYELK